MQAIQPTDIPATALLKLILAAWTAQMISVVARLGIADLLGEGPRRASELAEACGADASSLERVLRALVHAGVFHEIADGRIGLTEIGDALRTDSSPSYRSIAAVCGQHWHLSAWSNLLHSVKTGETAFDRIHGRNLTEYLAQHSEATDWYESALASIDSVGEQLGDGALLDAMLQVERLVVSREQPALLERFCTIPSLHKKSA